MEILHNTLEIIDDMDISEGHKLILCNELKKLSNNEKLMKPIKKRIPRDKIFERIYNNIMNRFNWWNDRRNEIKTIYNTNKYSLECLERWILNTYTDDDYEGILRIKYILETAYEDIYYRENRYNNLILQLDNSNNNKVDKLIKKIILEKLIEHKKSYDDFILEFTKKDYVKYICIRNKYYYLNKV